MTDRTEHRTEQIPVTEPGHAGTPVTPPGTAPAGVPDGAREAAPATAPRDGGRIGRRGGDLDDVGVPPAPRTAPDAPRAERTGGHHETAGSDRSLIAGDDHDKLSQRMQQAVTDFVESPRRAVEEADSTFDEIVSGLTQALADRRRDLRASWQEQDTEAQTEELRVALQRYRDLSEQLLRI
ncbi:hypothetical protein ACFVS9_16355 [Streptomyces sp. NPDC058008]|uniref:hypothetical protein n=1 Tax=Streptomyces sp. NPDC058008 TaxID=3346303 RepID=UPI0036F14F1B